MQPVQAFPPALRKMFRGAVHRGPLRALRKPQDPGKETRHPRLPPLFQTERGRRETGAGRSEPVRTDLGDHFFFREKRNGPHPKEKSLSGIGQSTPVSGAVEHCDHWEALLPGVTPCRCAAFGADVHPLGAPGCSLDSGVPASAASTPPHLPREGAPKGFGFVPKAPPGTAGGGQ